MLTWSRDGDLVETNSTSLSLLSWPIGKVEGKVSAAITSRAHRPLLRLIEDLGIPSGTDTLLLLTVGDAGSAVPLTNALTPHYPQQPPKRICRSALWSCLLPLAVGNPHSHVDGDINANHGAFSHQAMDS